MDLQEHSRPDALERYSFLWSEARLVVAAVALLIGGLSFVFALEGARTENFLSRRYC
jgi:hypothetical protein